MRQGQIIKAEMAESKTTIGNCLILTIEFPDCWETDPDRFALGDKVTILPDERKAK